MEERQGLVTMRGTPLTLVGNPVKVGDRPGDCTLLNSDLAEVKLSSFRGRVRIIASVPSLDTSVCDKQTRTFNLQAARLANDLVILTISMDLPFAQRRWCDGANVNIVRVLSDHRDAEFGMAFGVLIKELRLLARAIFVLSSQGVIRYIQIVPELAIEPDYDAAIIAAKNLLQPV